VHTLHIIDSDPLVRQALNGVVPRTQAQVDAMPEGALRDAHESLRRSFGFWWLFSLGGPYGDRANAVVNRHQGLGMIRNAAQRVIELSL